MRKQSIKERTQTYGPSQLTQMLDIADQPRIELGYQVDQVQTSLLLLRRGRHQRLRSGEGLFHRGEQRHELVLGRHDDFISVGSNSTVCARCTNNGLRIGEEGQKGHCMPRISCLLQNHGAFTDATKHTAFGTSGSRRNPGDQRTFSRRGETGKRSFSGPKGRLPGVRKPPLYRPHVFGNLQQGGLHDATVVLAGRIAIGVRDDYEHWVTGHD